MNFPLVCLKWHLQKRFTCRKWHWQQHTITGHRTQHRERYTCNSCRFNCFTKWWPLWWCVSCQQARQARCTWIRVRENGNDLASLDPANIVKDYVAGLMDRPCNVVWETQKQHSSQSSYNWQQRQAADDLWDWRHVFCVQSRRTSSCGLSSKTPSICCRKRRIFPKAQHLQTSREMESTAVSSTACADWRKDADGPRSILSWLRNRHSVDFGALSLTLNTADIDFIVVGRKWVCRVWHVRLLNISNVPNILSLLECVIYSKPGVWLFDPTPNPVVMGL